jgi:hypothetical protein
MREPSFGHCNAGLWRFHSSASFASLIPSHLHPHSSMSSRIAASHPVTWVLSTLHSYMHRLGAELHLWSREILPEFWAMFT